MVDNDNSVTRLPWNNDVLNICTLLSLILSIENLELNKKEVSNNDLKQQLDKQDKILIEEIKSDLKVIIKQNNYIIELLKGEKNE